MKNLQIRFVLSTITLFSILMAVTTATAAPVRFDQVVQIINAKPGKANTGSFSQLRLVNGEIVLDDKDDDNKDGEKIKTVTPQQDDRVIIETTSEIVEDDVCDCDQPQIATRKFPYWALLGLAAVPLLFLIPNNDDDTPTPTPTVPTTMTPTPTDGTPTPTPTTPTPTPTTPTPTPTTPTPTPTTPTPTPPEAVPEPMTLLLFGTGLASIGLAARKKFGKKDDDKTEE